MNILIINKNEGYAGPMRKIQPQSTSQTYSFNQRSVSTQTEINQTRYSEPSPFDCRSNIAWRLKPGTPIGRSLNAAKCYFAAMEISNAGQETVALLASVLQREVYWLFTNYDYQLNIQQIERYTDLIKRRVANEPLEYLIKVQVQI